ncbi:MAG: TraR/DksA family transcriptional regulator [Gammaproteobacteria bacterium]|nr:TraR/DksA family transcriptional regulator [Gammaproteobacteria bacterium]
MNPKLDGAFLERQRLELLRLRATLVAATAAAESEEAEVRTQRTDGALEAEEDAQQLDALERGDDLVGRSIERLGRVDRALQKLEEGTYGVSDVSGQPIGRERLEAVPEALCTLSEERSLEHQQR